MFRVDTTGLMIVVLRGSNGVMGDTPIYLAYALVILLKALTSLWDIEYGISIWEPKLSLAQGEVLRVGIYLGFVFSLCRLFVWIFMHQPFFYH